MNLVIHCLWNIPTAHLVNQITRAEVLHWTIDLLGGANSSFHQQKSGYKLHDPPMCATSAFGTQ